MSWYRSGTVAVTNGSKTVTGVGTLWTTAVSAGDAFALVDANLNPTDAWYEVESVTNNTTLVLKQSYAGSTGSNKQYCVFNLVGNMTTPSFAQRLATFFASFQSLIDKPTTTPTASSIPIADSGGKIADGWIPATVARTASPTLTGTPVAPTAPKATNTTQLATTAHVKSVVADYAPLASPALTGSPTAPTQTASDDSTKIATTAHVKDYLGSIGHGDTLMNALVATSTDWNDLPTESGGSMSWKFVNGNTTVTNAPPALSSAAYTHFYVTHMRYTSNTILQIAMPYYETSADASIYIRTSYLGTWGRWYRQYSEYNILGTVSQSGGVPTGAVIERGSNANGEYVKFADGTQICLHGGVIGGVWGTSIELDRSWTFPAAFSTAPIFVHYLYGGVSVGSGMAILQKTVSATAVTMRVKNNTDVDVGNGGENFEKRIAIGRWF